MEQGILSVDRIVGAEEHFFAAVTAYRFDGGAYGNPCRVTVEVGQLEVGQPAEQIQRDGVVGAQIHVYHDEFYLGVAFRGVVEVR